jgi:hypothetical protein
MLTRIAIKTSLKKTLCNDNFVVKKDFCVTLPVAYSLSKKVRKWSRPEATRVQNGCHDFPPKVTRKLAIFLP